MSVKRYDMKEVFKGRMAVVETSAGAFVTHGDYSVIEQNLTDMAVQLANAESKCAALAAENAALKAFGGKLGDMHNDLNGEGTGIQGRAEVAIQQVALEAAIEEFDAINTSATDALLAEVRASGADEVSAICRGLANKDGCSVNMRCSYNLTAERAEAVAAQLRKGAAL
ncbi:hypothetical protein RQL81_19305 [Citrobacter braakii]|nr:hypothetical protein [Citrobacter braakii]